MWDSVRLELRFQLDVERGHGRCWHFFCSLPEPEGMMHDDHWRKRRREAIGAWMVGTLEDISCI